MYTPTWVEAGLMAGSFGLFFTLILLFVRLLPSVAVTELKAATLQGHGEAGHG